MTYLRYAFLLLLLSVAIASCQKEQDVDPLNTKINTLKGDSVARGSLNSPGNYLAIKGTLSVTIEDSTYIFDAEKDSIAFVNVLLDSNNYFGITAINKAHTISFGISSAGVAGADVNSAVAGSQLLYNVDDKPGLQYTLASNLKDAGEISLVQYLKDSSTTAGTFYTSLAKKGKPNSAAQKVIGSFNLKLRQ